MTCKAMRLRLLPWIWDLIEPSRCRRGFPAYFLTNLVTLVDASHADASLATNIKYLCALFCPGVGLIRSLKRFMTVPVLLHDTISEFIKCLQSLPNLHTLEIASCDPCPRKWKKLAPKRAKLLQIKALVLPPAAHPLLRHCPNVEDIDWVMRDRIMTYEELIGSLASTHNSKVKRLAIPLILPTHPSCKQWSALQDHVVRLVTDRLQSQYLWLDVQASPSLQSSTLTHTHTDIHSARVARMPSREEFRSAQSKVHALRY